MDWSGYLASQGRGGDTMLAHITPKEAALLKALGGSGTINPRTGLREFWDDGGNDPGGVGGNTGSTGNGGGSGSASGRGGLGDDPAAGNYGGWGGGYSSGMPGDDPNAYGTWGGLGIGLDNLGASYSAWGTQIGHNAPMGIASAIGFNPADITVSDIAKTAAKALAIAMSANPIGAAIMAGTMAAIDFGIKDAKALSRMTDEERATALANNKTEIPASPIDATDTSGRKLGGYFNEKIVEENEESLNNVLAKAGEVGNMKLAIEATQKFSETTAKQVEFEAQVRRYSDDPEFDSIEPELRVLADAAIKKGVPPSEAVKYAYEAVKKLRGYRIRLADMVNKAKVTESENIGVNNMEVPL